MASGIAGSRSSTIIIRTWSCNPQPVALLSSVLASFSGSLSLGGFRKASGNSRFRAHSLSSPSGKRASSSQVSQHKSKNYIPLLRLGSGEQITLVRRCQAVMGQVSHKPISGSRGVDNNPHLNQPLEKGVFSKHSEFTFFESSTPGQQLVVGHLWVPGATWGLGRKMLEPIKIRADYFSQTKTLKCGKDRKCSEMWIQNTS